MRTRVVHYATFSGENLLCVQRNNTIITVKHILSNLNSQTANPASFFARKIQEVQRSTGRILSGNQSR